MSTDTIIDGVPPGPRTPMPVQTLGMLTRQRPYLERLRRRYGNMFSIDVLGLGPMVVLAEPDLIKHTFQADPTVLHAGSRSPLRRVLGDNSLLGIDEDHHMEQRKLLLPPFKGARMKAYEPLIEEIAIAEVETWPVGVEFPTAKSMQRITLRAILRAVFGAEGARLRELEELLPPWTEQGQHLSRFPQIQKDWGRFSPWGRFLALRARVDAILDTLIEDTKNAPDLAERPDVLALMVQARREDGSPLANAEIRDQLVTMLAAGHETTAHTLSWAVERLRRNPDVLARLVAEVDEGGKALRDATILEVQRQRPVISFAGRHTIKPFEVGGYRIPQGRLIGLSAGLTHYDPNLFERPDVFNPDRFMDARPGTYSWIPFGGGRRRCIGATFAHMELDVVLRVILERVAFAPTAEPDEPWKFKGVAWSPAGGGMARVTRRPARAARAPEVAAAA
ncbi:Putative cytochrome P450 138 [Baekduia alba]|uniref:cytochrome P450 n=1 Tax=Baekduia alba TaxID=2997333 RepID=UPI002340EEE6|nr:cytochrome P450 [Baekduia alba]WCB94405.1 Putative cytochrome P450 138 [Baekduia alba]